MGTTFVASTLGVLSCHFIQVRNELSVAGNRLKARSPAFTQLFTLTLTQADGRPDGRTVRWMDVQMERWSDRWMYRRMDG